MFTTVIEGKNTIGFLFGMSSEIIHSCDLFIGALDDETETACGVLAAEVIRDDMVAIRHILVGEKWRRKGAATALMTRLMKVAAETGVNAILCAHPRAAGDGVKEFLEAMGFAPDPDETEDAMELFSFSRNL